jgi:FkbM family methyltransferase
MIKKFLNKFSKQESQDDPGLAKFKKIAIGEFKLTAHVDHSLDIYLSEYPDYSRNFPRIAHQILKDNPDAAIIDIGANIGDTVALLRKYNVANHVICVEGDEAYYSLLQENAQQFSDVTLLKYYLSDKKDKKAYQVEKKDGTARIVESLNSSIQSSIITLDEINDTTGLGVVRIIKIDTDGFDCKIIRGSLKTIDKFRPVLFFEYDYDLSKKQNEAPLDVLLMLREHGYNGIIYFDNFGKTICATTLNDEKQLIILDNYIQDGKGSFPYYDVLVFHKDDDLLMDEVLTKELNLNGSIN